MNKRSPWPWMITLVISLFAAYLVWFAVFSTRNRVHLVSPDYYERELKHQEQIDKELRTRLLATKPLLKYDAATRKLVITFPDQGSIAGMLKLYRPSDAARDQEIPLNLNQGMQTVDAAALVPGLWKMQLAWNVNGEEYFLEQDLVVP